MKPQGRKYFGSGPAKVDCHPPKGYINWWEDACTPNKRLEQRRVAADIREQLEEYYEDLLDACTTWSVEDRLYNNFVE